jgi:hypothetical protein
MDLGGEGLLDKDQWLLEVNLGEMEESSDEQEQYWQMTIRAAQEVALLTQQRDRTWHDGTKLKGC